MGHEFEALTRFKKRERTQNWTFSEKKFLLDLCRRDMKIIENKRLDSALIALKNRAWKLIHQRFARTFGPDRNCNRLKEQFRRMKALSRSEIMDYSHRLSRFGQDVADRKRPSSFSFEIWEFMQEAKRVCKSESMDNVDYSKMESSLERDGYENSDSSHQKDLALRIGDEVETQNEIIDDIADQLEHTDARINSATRRIEVVSAKDRTWPYWSIIIGLFVAIIIVALI
uniref:Regulatory protein zeste n=1 Tax=Lutzomyia longipalpis TaxID=7200 RepID=A0A7G3B4C0_LUTLO